MDTKTTYRSTRMAKIGPRGWLILLVSVAGICITCPSAFAVTLHLSGNRHLVSESAVFDVSNEGANSFVFSWSNNSAVYTASNPTLMLVPGQTYTFTRRSAGHPLAFTSGALPVDELQDGWARATRDVDVLLAFLLPISDPHLEGINPTNFGDAPLTFSPSEAIAGHRFFYTSSVLDEIEMTGLILIIPEPHSLVLFVSAALGILLVRHRRRPGRD